MEVGQAKRIMGHLLSVEFVEVRTVVLGELPHNVAGDLHLPTDTKSLIYHIY